MSTPNTLNTLKRKVTALVLGQCIIFGGISATATFAKAHARAHANNSQTELVVPNTDAKDKLALAEGIAIHEEDRSLSSGKVHRLKSRGKENLPTYAEIENGDYDLGGELPSMGI